MLEKEQYRSVIRYLFLKCKTRQETVKELNEVFGGDCPSLATIKRWFNDRFNTKDDLKEAVTNWLSEKPSDFYEEAFLELARRWRNVSPSMRVI